MSYSGEVHYLLDQRRNFSVHGCDKFAVHLMYGRMSIRTTLNRGKPIDCRPQNSAKKKFKTNVAFHKLSHLVSPHVQLPDQNGPHFLEVVVRRNYERSDCSCSSPLTAANPRRSYSDHGTL